MRLKYLLIILALFAFTSPVLAQEPCFAIDMDPATPGFQDVRIMGSPGEIYCDVYAVNILNLDSYDVTIQFNVVMGDMAYAQYLGAIFDNGDDFPVAGCSSVYWETLAGDGMSTEVVESISGSDEACAPDGSVHLFSFHFNIMSVPENTIIELFVGGTLAVVSDVSYFPAEITASLQGTLVPTEDYTWGAIKTLFK